MQVEPMKFKLKAHVPKRLKVQYNALLSSFHSNFNLRRYWKAGLDEQLIARCAKKETWEKCQTMIVDAKVTEKMVSVVGRCRLTQA